MTPEPASSTKRIDEEKAIAVLALAFSADPATRWAWPDPQRYLETFPDFIRAMGGGAFAHGTAYCAEGYVGAALWLPPGVRSDEEALVELTQRTVDESRYEEMFAVFEQMGTYHLTEPHWYLPLIGVDPAHQGRGHGRGLMQSALDACDRDGLPAYLESSNARNISFYERLGFEVLGKIQTGGSPTITPMLRKAKRRTILP
jgi:GNAT superfamily N-acetyltransferase